MISSCGTTPSSEEAKSSRSVSPTQRGRSPMASTLKTQRSRVAGDDGGRALGAGGEKAPEPAVHAACSSAGIRSISLKIGGKTSSMASNRVKPMPADQSFQGPVQVLGVAAARREVDAEHPGLFPQAGDGIDLAVMAEQREGLGAQDGRQGIGGVAAVADGDARTGNRAASVRDSSGAGSPARRAPCRRPHPRTGKRHGPGFPSRFPRQGQRAGRGSFRVGTAEGNLPEKRL